MGVHGLWKLIESSGKPVPLETLENRVLAVDVSIWLYQLVKGFQEKAGQSVANAYLLGLFHRICKLLFYRIRPIFVFDGGVPALKRKTIAARQSNRKKAEIMGEKLRLSLFENLVKQEALGNAIGESFVLPKMFQPKQDALFELPPIPTMPESEEVNTDSDEEVFKYKDIGSIDIESEDFLSLPPDMRHDILTDLKETRKQNSWAKLHLMPEEGGEFSNFQMSRLLKRRAIQVGIEQAEGEMGTRGFTISDLQSILSEQGIELAKRIAADNKTKLLYSDKLKGVSQNIKDTKVEISGSKKKKIKENYEEFCIERKSDFGIESKDESLTQNEILEIIKSEKKFIKTELEINDQLVKGGETTPSSGVGNNDTQKPIKVENIIIVHDDNNKTNVADGALSNSDQKNSLLETEVRKESVLNDLTKENETKNNELKLEHGIFSRSSSHCQFPSLPSTSSHPELISNSQSNRDGTSKIFNYDSTDHLTVVDNEDVLVSPKNLRIATSDQNYKEIKKNESILDEIRPFTANSSISDSVDIDGLNSSSDDSNDFIEVVNEQTDLGIIYSNNTTSCVNKPDETVLSNNSLPSEIIIPPLEKLEDDMFSDIFNSENKSEDVSVAEKITIENHFHDESRLMNNRAESEQLILQSDFPLTEEVSKFKEADVTNVISQELEETLKSTVQQLSVDEITSRDLKKKTLNSTVSQLSVDEVLKMKKDLENESNYLVSETNKEERIASSITEQITLDAQELLQLFGIPFIIAPMEAEAQCAYLDLTNQTQGTITDDSDIWLFGARNVYKNFFDQKKFVQQFKSTDINRCFHMEREDMIMLALLSGSDYTQGLIGVGAVTALEVIAHFPKTEKEVTIAERLTHFSEDYKKSQLKPNISSKLKKVSISEGFPSADVIKAYLEPLVDQSTDPFSWSKPNLRELRRYAREKFGWDETRTDKFLQPIFENLNKTQGQGTLHRYFEWNFDSIENKMSKRVEKAVTLLKTPSLLETEPTSSKTRKNIIDNPSTSQRKKIIGNRSTSQRKNSVGNPVTSPLKNVIGDPSTSERKNLIGDPIINQRKNIIGNPGTNKEKSTNSNITMRSKTPAQLAREKAAKKLKELRESGKLGTKKKGK